MQIIINLNMKEYFSVDQWQKELGSVAYSFGVKTTSCEDHDS